MFPVRMADNRAHIHPLELRILRGQKVIIEGSKGGLRPMLHALVERVDDPVFEVGFARKRRDDSITLRLCVMFEILARRRPSRLRPGAAQFRDA